MASPATSYRSISRISKWLVHWSVASIIISIIIPVAYFSNLLSTNEHSFLNPDGSILIFFPTYFEILLSFTSFVVVFVTAIIGLYWFYRANKNIHAFGAKEITSPRMAVIWWFVPIFHLWRPYFVAQQIWKASNPQIVISGGTEWKNSFDSNDIKLWWVMMIFAIIINIFGQIFLQPVGAQIPFEPIYEERRILVYQDFQVISTNVLFIVSTIFFILMIRQISTWQEIKSGKSI